MEEEIERSIDNIIEDLRGFNNDESRQILKEIEIIKFGNRENGIHKAIMRGKK